MRTARLRQHETGRDGPDPAGGPHGQATDPRRPLGPAGARAARRQRIQKLYPDFPCDEVEEFLLDWVDSYDPENYSQAQLDELDSLTARWVADHIRMAKASKNRRELVTLELMLKSLRNCRSGDPRRLAGGTLVTRQIARYFVVVGATALLLATGSSGVLANQWDHRSGHKIHVGSPAWRLAISWVEIEALRPFVRMP
jgi:hypothetical protein